MTSILFDVVFTFWLGIVKFAIRVQYKIVFMHADEEQAFLIFPF